MMLSILGFGMVITFMYLIMSKRLSPLVALITIPIIFALIGGFDRHVLQPCRVQEMAGELAAGARQVRPVGKVLQPGRRLPISA